MAQPVSEEKFLQIYGNLLVQTWGDPELKARFKANTVEVLKEFGLDPGTAKVNLLAPMDPPPENATAESQVMLWNDGLASGSIDFMYPEEPPEGIDGLELSEEQLESVAGGWSVGSCCCSPCCCC